MTVCPKKKKFFLAELQSVHLRDVILTNRSTRGDAFGWNYVYLGASRPSKRSWCEWTTKQSL